MATIWDYTKESVGKTWQEIDETWQEATFTWASLAKTSWTSR